MERHEQPRLLLPRRVATAPTIAPPPTKTEHSGEKVQEEIGSIYNHANAKVISLVALSDQTYSLDSSKRDTVGPWQSHFERTIAFGSLRLYRAPGSVAFLSCGSALQPMLPKSQCWCMEDDGSKFILQIRPPSYWRIEIASPDSPGRSLRDCLESILLLDKTPCPFKESVPILLPPGPLSVQKRQPWKPLRSYSSELTLSKSSSVCDDNQPLKKGSNKRAIAEQKVEHPNEVVQKEDRSHEMESPKVTKGSETPRSAIQVKVDFSVLLDEHPKAVVKPKLPTLCTQYASGLGEGPDSSKNTACSVLGIKQTSIPLERDSMVVTKANQTIKPTRPNKKQPEKNECIGTNRGGRHRQTVASSWRDVDMAALAKITSGDGGMPSIGPNRPKVATTAHETQLKESFEAAMILEVALAQGTSQLESYPYGQPPYGQPHPKLAPQLRLRRKELIDADDTPTTEAGGCARGSSSADAYSSAYSTPSVLLFKGICTLFRAIFGIVALGCRTVIIIVVRWWMPVEETGSKTGVPALSVDDHDTPVFLDHNAKY